jgi:hypothetical protein
MGTVQPVRPSGKKFHVDGRHTGNLWPLDN